MQFKNPSHYYKTSTQAKPASLQRQREQAVASQPLIPQEQRTPRLRHNRQEAILNNQPWLWPAIAAVLLLPANKEPTAVTSQGRTAPRTRNHSPPINCCYYSNNNRMMRRNLWSTAKSHLLIPNSTRNLRKSGPGRAYSLNILVPSNTGAQHTPRWRDTRTGTPVRVGYPQEGLLDTNWQP